MRLEFRILGHLEVLDGDTRLELPAPKVRTLLLRLLVNAGEPVSVDSLIDALWDDTPPASAEKLVQVYVSQLRKALGASLLRTTPNGYQLDVSPSQLDAHRFADVLSEAKSVAMSGNAALAGSLFRRALALWHGPAYADVQDAQFAAAAIAQLDELKAECLEGRLGAELEAGGAEEVAAEVFALISRFPLRERLRAIHVRALTLAGQRADALEAYQQARRALRDELGLAPGEELQQAQMLALQDEPPPARPVQKHAVLGRIPEPATPLLGREQELAELERLLARREVRLLSLTGAGGSGKTRLAFAAARMVEGTFANGVALVELASLREASLIPTAIALALGMTPSTGDEALAEVGDWLVDRELLLVVDNVEHLPEGFHHLGWLVSRAPRLTVLVTGRRVMHLSGEQIFPVGPLGEDAATELFIQRARASYPAFAPEGSEAAIAAICRRLDGLPLAIELAAARAATLPPEELLERLTHSLTVLTSGASDLPSRQRTLRETLEGSASLLTPAQRAALARLSVFPAGCTLLGAETHAGADLGTLTTLVDDHLLVAGDVGGQRRFVMLETVREYAGTLLGDDELPAATSLVAYCVDLLERAELRGPDQSIWLPVIDVEQDNIRAALALEIDADARLRLIRGMWRYWWIRGQLEEGRAWIAQILSGSDTADGQLRASALNAGAGLALSAGDLSPARDLAEAGLAQARTSDDAFEEMRSHNCLGLIAMEESDFAAGRHHHEYALELARENGWEMDVVTSELNLAIALLQDGALDAARDMLTKLLAYHRDGRNDEGVGFASLNLGDAAYRADDSVAMEEHFAQATDAFMSIGFEANAAYATQGLAAAAVMTGDAVRAATLLGRAARMLSGVGGREVTFEEMTAKTEATARAVLGEVAFAEAFDVGYETSGTR
jgi:predicted ATPase/DNA-binding SARP family transcriptional activator